MTSEIRQAICATCGTAKAVKSLTRPPRGWKRVDETRLLCPDCTREAYVLRAVTVPLVGRPLEGDPKAFWRALRATLDETTRCANWIVTQLYARDVRRQPGAAKLAPMPAVYLYPEAREAFPGIVPIHLTALLQQVEQTYRQRRYELLWQSAISLPTYRDVPTPLHAQGYRLEPQADGRIVVHVRLDGQWWALPIRGGRHFHAQRQDLQAVTSGAALPAAGALSIRATRASDHRSGADGRHSAQRVLLKIVARFPRRPRRDLTATCQVSTAASDLLVARVHGQGIVTTVTGDHIRRAIRAYTVRRERLTTELGIVRRMLPSEREGMRRRLETMAIRQRRSLTTWCQQSAMQVVRAAVRAGAGTIRYEDEVQDFCAPFPWTGLRLALQHATHREGLIWEYASGSAGASEGGVARTSEETREVTEEMADARV